VPLEAWESEVKAAIYARYSTDRQTESSIVDQYRVCEDWCQKNGATVVARFEDQGISGVAMGNRPGLQSLLVAQVDVVLVMDLTRLSRSQADLPKMIDRFVARGIRVVGAQDGYDSGRKGHRLQAGLTGIIGEAFREMVSDKTYAALESRAHRGEATGGRAYGYRDGEAEVVKRIFQMYADGASAKTIAETLNREGVPSPGSTWNRTTRRRGGWAPSAISGDPTRGVGILNNEVYVGRDVWNRSRWIKDPDSGKRRCVQRPKSEWIVRDAPELRLVDDRLWNAVKARQARRQAEVGDAIRKKLKRSTGRAARYIFSSILKCNVCGSSYVLSDATHYSCSGYVNGRVCTNGQRFRRDVMEERLTAAIRTELLSDESVRRFRQKFWKAMQKPAVDQTRIQKLEGELANLTDVLASGVRSAAVLERLQATEAEVERLRASSNVLDVKKLLDALPAAVQRYRTMVADLGNAPVDRDHAREVIRSITGTIKVRPGTDGVPVAMLALANEMPLAAAAGGACNPLISAGQIDVVAGAGFEPATFGL
jgi:site-specific DNA recombinase